MRSLICLVVAMFGVVLVLQGVSSTEATPQQPEQVVAHYVSTPPQAPVAEEPIQVVPKSSRQSSTSSEGSAGGYSASSHGGSGASSGYSGASSGGQGLARLFNRTRTRTYQSSQGSSGGTFSRSTEPCDCCDECTGQPGCNCSCSNCSCNDQQSVNTVETVRTRRLLLPRRSRSAGWFQQRRSSQCENCAS